MSTIRSKSVAQEVPSDIKSKRFIGTFVCYAPCLSDVGELIKSGNATLVKVELDEDVKKEDKKIGF